MSRESLGKGLDALISTGPENTDKTTGITTLSIDCVIPNRYQPRRVFDPVKLAELSESMKQNGILQPIIVTKNADSKYELVAGERRLEAAKLAGFSEIPVIIRSITPQEQLQYAIIENIQREDLNAIEEARAYQRLNEEFGLTHSQISEVVGKERTTISNLIRLLKLDESIQNMILDGKLSSGHARAILQIDSARQLDFAEFIIKNNLSVRAAEGEARNISEKMPQSKKTASRKKEKAPEIRTWENNLNKNYSVRVSITGRQNKGRVSFFYNSKEELEALINKFQQENE